MPEARRLTLALLGLYLLFAWPCPPVDPMGGRALALAEAFSHGRLRVMGPERHLSADFVYPDGPAGGGVSVSEFAGPALFAPISFATRPLSSAEQPFTSGRLFVLSFLYIALLSALPAALGAGCLLLLLRRLNTPRPFLAATLFGSTLLLPQAAMVNPHGLSTLFLCLSLLLVSDRERTPRQSFLAGLSAGAAVLAYFGVLLPVAIPIGVYGVLTGTRRARVALVLGALGPALLLAAWNHVSYGAPWALPAAEHGLGGVSEVAGRNQLFSLSLPNVRRLLEVTIGARRGVLVFAPVFILGIAGLKPLWRRRRDLALLVISIAALAALQAAAKPISWHGGSAAGPRYLLPATLALAIPLGYGLAHFRLLSALLAAASLLFAACTAQTALYGSLQSCVEDVARLAPRLRLIHTVSNLIQPGDYTSRTALLSPLLALPALLGLVYWLRRDLPTPRRIGIGISAIWLALALPYLLLGERGHSPATIRRAEVQRFVLVEVEPLRLRWYAGELLALGDPHGAAEACLSAIERAGWEREQGSVVCLREALRQLEAAGRPQEVRRLLTRAARLKPSDRTPATD